MKLVNYLLRDGIHYGAVKNGKVVDLKTRFPYPDFVSFIAARGERQAEKLLEDEDGDYDYDRLCLLPVVPNPGKILCIGLNYESHRIEGGHAKTEHPIVFARWPESQTGHRTAIKRAVKVSTQLDFEAELLVVMARRTPRYTKRGDALKYVFGYSCYNEACHRDWQAHTRTLTSGKNFESTGASGPWLVTADEIPDPQALKFQMRLNGKVMQSDHTSQMIWPVNVVIEYITCWLPLNPGDLIVMGTPGGVGFKRTPPVFMQPGDIAEVEFEKIGTLTNRIEDE
ncbi:MAG: fumarylacetoacetate hydrolase family protein [Betaproteobacteria bacterium]|nr:fumarylacetoacetate hydrolase family protein [Betaproteobacteria bacterium]